MLIVVHVKITIFSTLKSPLKKAIHPEEKKFNKVCYWYRTRYFLYQIARAAYGFRHNGGPIEGPPSIAPYDSAVMV